MDISSLSPALSKTRSRWLTIFVIASFFGIINLIFDIYKTFPSYISNRGTLAVIIASYIIFASFTFATYHCAYKKHGTRFLTFLIITPIVGLFVLLMFNLNVKTSVLALVSQKIINTNSKLEYLFAVLSLTTSWTLYIFHFKLRKVNKKIKKILSPKDSDEAVIVVE